VFDKIKEISVHDRAALRKGESRIPSEENDRLTGAGQLTAAAAVSIGVLIGIYFDTDRP